MAGAAQPGPTCGHTNPINVNDGTSCRAPSPQPGILTRTWSTVTGWGDSIATSYDSTKASLQHTYQWAKGEARLDYEGGRCIYQAYLRANELAPAAILEETGYQLHALIAGLIPGLIQMIVILAGTTLLGGAIGGVIGFFFGGVGAAPGAVVGGELGLDAGLAILTWLGVAFLAVEIAKGMGEMLIAVSNGVLWAWAARKLAGRAQEREVQRAGHELARSIGILMRLILQAILAYLLKKAAMGATRSAVSTARAVSTEGAVAVSDATVAELVGKIRASKFGNGLADWVEKNWKSLRDNPKLKTPSPAPVNQGGAAAIEPPPEPQPKPAEPKPKPKRKPRQPSKNNKNIDQSRTTVNSDGTTTYYDLQGRPVTYSADGYPDFSPYSEGEVQVDGLTGNNAADARLANQEAGLSSTPEGYTWHHVEDGQTMQLVPEDIHDTFPHTGGASILRGPK